MATPFIDQGYPAALCNANPGRSGAIVHKRRNPELLRDGEQVSIPPPGTVSGRSVWRLGRGTRPDGTTSRTKPCIPKALSVCFPVALAALVLAGPCNAETWRGLTVAPEDRCSSYDKKRDYSYPQSIEREIVRLLGAVYGPYTGTCFASMSETDIEHIVAASEAHDSGLCSRDRATRTRFARDLRNLTLASPRVNRHQKSGKDAAQWLPARNRCWFAARVVEVRRAYGLTIDRREAATLEQVLSGCESTEMEPLTCHSAAVRDQGANRVPENGDGALARYDDNRNGRITCKEARRHGIAPVSRDHPAYRYMRDGDGDGTVCE